MLMQLFFKGEDQVQHVLFLFLIVESVFFKQVFVFLDGFRDLTLEYRSLFLCYFGILLLYYYIKVCFTLLLLLLWLFIIKEVII